MNIVFVDAGTFPAGYQFDQPNIDHTWRQFDNCDAFNLVERVKDADIVITNKVVFDASIIAQLPKLKMIAVAATGYNNVDLDACKAHGIAVNNVVNYSTDSVCEHILMMMLALSRKLVTYNQDSHQGHWQDNDYFCRQLGAINDISGKTLGIIGKGNLGASLAQKAEALGLKVLFAERKGSASIREGYTAFTDVLAQSDFISVNCPLTDDNYQLFSQQEFKQMKSSSIFINTARGPLVDEEALVQAIETNKISACGLDVVSLEPITASNPIKRLYGNERVLITPHIAWSSEAALANLVAGINANIEAFAQQNTQGFLLSI